MTVHNWEWRPMEGELIEVRVLVWNGFYPASRWLPARLLYAGGMGAHPARPYTVKLEGRRSLFSVREVDLIDMRPTDAVSALARVSPRDSLWSRVYDYLREIVSG